MSFGESKPPDSVPTQGNTYPPVGGNVYPPVGCPQPPNDPSQQVQNVSGKMRASFFTLILLLLIYNVAVIILIGNAKSQYNSGYYTGQTDFARWMEEWQLGKIEFSENMAVLRMTDKGRLVYFYNRNVYPDQRRYPPGRPPVSDQPMAPR